MKYRSLMLLILGIPIGILARNTDDFKPEDYETRTVNAQRIEFGMHIDGVLDEELYSFPSIGTFIQLQPDNGLLASEKTEAWIAYDDNALYIGAYCYDSQPDSIVGFMGRRDDFGNSDEFQVGIDSYHDKRSGYYFVINPVGAIGDGTFSNDSWTDDSWDGIWESAAQVVKDGWTVEMRIPFSQLRFVSQDAYTWGIGLGRKIQRHDEQSFITFYRRDESVLVSKFANLLGIENISPPHRLEYFPYVTSGYSILPNEKHNSFYMGSDLYGRLGGDIKIGIGNNLTIDATINPDFGQVESDPASLNLGAFETIYNEKRPFFVEGSSIFSFGNGGPSNRYGFNFSEPDFVYSRRIGHSPHGGISSSSDSVKIPSSTAILGAAKLSGKITGNNSIGFFTAVTRREYAEINEEGKIFEEEIEPVSYFNVFRELKEFSDGKHGLGILITRVDRNFKLRDLKEILPNSATTWGIDGWTFFGKDRKWALGGWVGQSNIKGSKTFMTDLQYKPQHYFQRPDASHLDVDSAATSMTGTAGRFMLNKEKGNWLINASVGFITPTFDSQQLGLTWNTDRINEHLMVGYTWREPGKYLRRSSLQIAQSTNHNYDGEKINAMNFLFGGAQLLNYWHLDFMIGWGPETLSDTHLRGGPMVISPDGHFQSISVGSDFRKSITYGFGFDRNANRYNESGGGAYTWINFKLGPNFKLYIEPSIYSNRSETQYVGEFDGDSLTPMASEYGKHYVVAQLENTNFTADIRLDYTFNPKLSLQTYIQPYVTNGTYSDYKEFAKSRSYEFFHYSDIGQTVLWDDDSELYYLGEGTKPDLDVKYRYASFITNAVLRWEFRPGSTIYMVWTHNADEYVTEGNTSIKNGFNSLFSISPNDLFALKVSYWFGV